MNIVRTSQRLLGIREDIQNIFECTSNHPFLDLLRSELRRIEEIAADIESKDLLSPAIVETSVDEAIDRLGLELYTPSDSGGESEDSDYEDSEEPTRPSLSYSHTQDSGRSFFLVDAKGDTLGGDYPRNLVWSTLSHREKIRQELRQLISYVLNSRRRQELSRSKSQTGKKDITSGSERSGLSMGGVAGTEPTSTRKRAAASPPEDIPSRLEKRPKNEACAVAKVHFLPEWPDFMCLQACSTATELFHRLEEILASHSPKRIGQMKLTAIRVSIGKNVRFRLGQTICSDYGFQELLKAVGKKQEEDEVRFDPEVYQSTTPVQKE